MDLRPKTIILQPEGATTMERVDKMVRTIFAGWQKFSERTASELQRLSM